MTDRLLFRAALSRFIIAAYIVVVLPSMYPGLVDELPILALYVVSAMMFQWMVARGIGGRLRAAVSGVIDVAIITAFAHWTGSVTTSLVAIYFYATSVNTLVVGRRVGLLIASWAGFSFAVVAILASSTVGILEYAPHAPPELAGVQPNLIQAISAAVMLAALLLTTNLVVGHLVALNEAREAELVRVNAHLAELSARDPLSGLLNRRAFFEELQKALYNASLGARRENDPDERAVAVAMIDLDKFKRINDERGHADGDLLLAKLACTIRETVREGDRVARYGGDEFVILFVDGAAEEAKAGVERVVETVREASLAFDAERPVSASVGLAFAVPGDTPESLIAKADELAYRAKRAGGDRYET